jgi:cytoskeletal protein CcmA (bactofilin family)
MFFKKKKKSREVQQIIAEPSYIARDTTLEGNLICDGEIHIDGAVRGSVRAHTCLVEEHGEVHGEISADNIFIRGRVIGPVNGINVHIHAGAHVEGNVMNETLSIENGAYVYGSIRHGGVQGPSGGITLNNSALSFPDPKPIRPLKSEDDDDKVWPLKAKK